MKYGVTGTRSEMTIEQLDNVREFLYVNRNMDNTLNHGDCVGVDVKVADMATDMGYMVINHPPLKDDLRAFHQSDEIREPFSYFKRNRNIVDESDILLVVPYQNEWCANGGTWYTHDYANKHSKDIIIFYPNGGIWEKVRSKLF